MIESLAVAMFWSVLGFGVGLWAGAEIVKRTTKPVQVSVDASLIRAFCETHGLVLMPKGPEWEPKPGERLQ